MCSTGSGPIKLKCSCLPEQLDMKVYSSKGMAVDGGALVGLMCEDQVITGMVQKPVLAATLAAREWANSTINTAGTDSEELQANLKTHESILCRQYPHWGIEAA